MSIKKKRQIRRQNSISDLTDIIPKKAPSTRKTITDKVLEALTSPDVLNKIIPILSEKICETIEATITDIVDDKIKTHVDAHVNALIETVNKQQKTITEHKHFKSSLTFPLSSTGTLMLWKRRLVRLEYCS
jgi:acetoacetate decarboxylase